MSLALSPAVTQAVAFASSAMVAFAVATAVRRIAIRAGAVVPTRPDRWHREPTPSYGGIGILAGLLVSLVFHLSTVLTAAPALAATIALFFVGWYDDVRPLSAV